MAYSSEVIRRAQDRLAQAKADQESKELRNLMAAYERLPRLKQIDLELRQTMAEAARNAFIGNGDAKAALEKVRQENLALQQERRELIARHFGEGYLDDSPICAACGGSGYVGARMCECLTELCRQEQRKELTLLAGGEESFERFRLDYYSDVNDPKYGFSPRTIMERNFQCCRRYAAAFSLDAGNLLLIGGTGLGKTFLSACIARTVADRGYSVCYETANHLFTNLEQARFRADENALRETAKYAACDLLIIDDLGTEMPGQFVTAALYGLLNDRLQEKKPVVISTNLNVDEAERRYSPQIASRLRGNFKRLTFVGSDIRVMKNR